MEFQIQKNKPRAEFDSNKSTSRICENTSNRYESIATDDGDGIICSIKRKKRKRVAKVAVAKVTKVTKVAPKKGKGKKIKIGHQQ